jgi:pimeloyl-ACP methyl ester carboxylesterase
MPALQREGLALAYADAGEGPPFVFQHGLGGDASQPASQAPMGYRLMTLECRGHGASPLGTEDALGFETFAGDVEALLDALGLGRVVLGGISMGAGVALTLARRAPARVRVLVLVRPAWTDRGWPRNLHVFAEIAALLRQREPAAAKLRFTTRSSEYRRIRAISPTAAASLVGQFDRPHARERAAVLERLPADRPLRPTDDWDALAMPALVLGARRDPVHPFSCAVALRDRLPRAVLREVPPKEHGEARHRNAVAEAIAAFLCDLPAEVGARPVAEARA